MWGLVGVKRKGSEVQLVIETALKRVQILKESEDLKLQLNPN